ncbi:hypothetical protein [Pedobacter nutrimenti]|jgi:hypothetical protein|uniref:Lipoprotein n=1 Tax=Pedobacter nutrimenti TaxID=1241337 RepID=A0A318U8A2_9SPHI|nr:hypothetical protein [Pedobacter nutrimenti]PYF70695.1 hypothetical protein B0O44_108121 [Pedobacter nutrimenti]|eukprot:gene3325-3782_t
MNNAKNIRNGLMLLLGLAFSSCSIGGLDLQKDYKYEKKELDPRLYKSARQYLEDRGTSPLKAGDTVFKYMKLGLDYAGIDLGEYEKSGRTFIFLHNDAIRVLDDKTKIPKSGMWFDIPVIMKDVNGQPIKDVDGIKYKTRPATKWSDYSKETVKNYFLYLIIQGEYGFDNAVTTNTTMQTLLPPNRVAAKDESLLSYIVTKAQPKPGSMAASRAILWDAVGSPGFDPEGKINMKITYTDGTPLVINDLVPDRSAGQIATNGPVHVFGATVWPFRYSYFD